MASAFMLLATRRATSCDALTTPSFSGKSRHSCLGVVFLHSLQVAGGNSRLVLSL